MDAVQKTPNVALFINDFTLDDKYLEDYYQCLLGYLAVDKIYYHKLIAIYGPNANNLIKFMESYVPGLYHHIGNAADLLDIDKRPRISVPAKAQVAVVDHVLPEHDLTIFEALFNPNEDFGFGKQCKLLLHYDQAPTTLESDLASKGRLKNVVIIHAKSRGNPSFLARFASMATDKDDTDRASFIKWLEIGAKRLLTQPLVIPPLATIVATKPSLIIANDANIAQVEKETFQPEKRDELLGLIISLDPVSFDCLTYVIKLLFMLRPNYYDNLAKRSPERVIKLQFLDDASQIKFIKNLIKKLQAGKLPTDKELKQFPAIVLPVPMCDSLTEFDPVNWKDLCTMRDLVKKEMAKPNAKPPVIVLYMASVKSPSEASCYMLAPIVPGEQVIQRGFGHILDDPATSAETATSMLAFNQYLEQIDTSDLKSVSKAEHQVVADEMLANIKNGCCISCRKDGPHKRCGKCSAAPYCSRECQTKDWPKHKTICPILKQTRVAIELAAKGELRV